ncbi:CFEM domain-containing protein [Phlyctema vagabunda]|uniref:CFEM domain-containing protein n=1 Tax=Phlyctema vagabunda TaxID=108571 RepID=A0ABR4PAV1_9HELO
MKIGIENVGIDDYVIIVAGLAMIPFTGLGMLLGFKGLGKDMWEVPFDNITYIFEIYFIDESIFFLILALTKTAIILFYLRIFPDRGFRKIAYGMLAINVIWGFVVILITIFQCAPVHYFWERWDKTTNGKCNNSHAQAWASAIVNIVLDLAILILPLPQLLKVALKPKKKFHVCMMFSVGIFVTITSILRLRTLIQFANSHNPLWDYVPATYWSAIEADVGIICACMPAIRSLLGSYFPALFDTSISSSGGVNSTPYMPPPPQILSQTHRSRAGLKPGDENHFVQLDEIHMDEYTLGGGGGGGGGGGERKTEREKMRERREKEMAGDLEDDDDHDHAYPGGATADFHSEHGSERGIIQKRSESQMEQRRSLEKGRRGTMGLAV